MTEEPWDGTERRNSPTDVGQQVVAAIHQVSSYQDNAVVLFQNRTLLGLMIGVSVGVAMLTIVLVSQFRLAESQRRAQENQRRFRNSITCFVVETFGTAPDAPPDRGVLTKCGFITTPGN